MLDIYMINQSMFELHITRICVFFVESECNVHSRSEESGNTGHLRENERPRSGCQSTQQGNR